MYIFREREICAQLLYRADRTRVFGPNQELPTGEPQVLRMPCSLTNRCTLRFATALPGRTATPWSSVSSACLHSKGRSATFPFSGKRWTSQGPPACGPWRSLSCSSHPSQLRSSVVGGCARAGLAIVYRSAHNNDNVYVAYVAYMFICIHIEAAWRVEPASQPAGEDAGPRARQRERIHVCWASAMASKSGSSQDRRDRPRGSTRNSLRRAVRRHAAH